ncbi:MAG: CHRD domain-containing protein [Comamonadaceae bacterium]|nr:MAG: CHRD domain-containing protein [Comamonadaceae bacterium]
MRTPQAGWRAAASAAFLATVFLAGCAAPSPPADSVFGAALGGKEQATGEAEAAYDHRTRILRWRVTHAGLSGPVTGAHIHGPAGPGQQADIVLPLAAASTQAITGQARITPEQWNQLDSGQWYVDLHTQGHPGGEVRGQLRPRR